ncbi:MAG: hypothetical protein ACI4RR_08455, partial [Eubacterium sp.]
MSIIEIKSVNATPFITKTGFQKTEITLINKRHKISLWAKIAVGDKKPYTFYLGMVHGGVSKKAIPVTDTYSDLKLG